MYVASQILEIIALIITLIAYQLKTKKQIFKGMCIANIFDIAHYLLLNAYSGFSTKLMALIRNLFIIEKEKNKKLNKKLFLILFIICYIVLGIYTFKNIYSILPFTAAIIYMIVVWNGNELQVKKIAFICYFIWLIYNICIHSIMAVIANIISLILTYIAYYNRKKEENEKYYI